MTEPATHNTFYHGDCLLVMKHDLLPGSVDLIYLDPPFFTGKIQKGTRRKWQPEAMEISFEDSKSYWASHLETMRQKAPRWLSAIGSNRPEFAAYLYYMMERLDACKRVLKKTGSIYLHCDWRASHYLKIVMDDVFEPENFQNEVVWHYGLGGSSKKRWARKHHVILFYSKSPSWTFNPKMIPATSQKMQGQLKKSDDVWDIPSINNMSTERVGYPTQKPLDLLRQIIQVSSNEGNIILDPFCGCGTAILAAHELDRRWIGIDINKEAWNTILDRANKPSFYQWLNSFSEAQLISRDPDSINSISPNDFQNWVNGWYKATRPKPDRGIDGITPDGIGIQSKTYEINYEIIDRLVQAARHHPATTKPIKKAIAVSQTGFSDSARDRQDSYKDEGIKIILAAPKKMLDPEKFEEIL